MTLTLFNVACREQKSITGTKRCSNHRTFSPLRDDCINLLEDAIVLNPLRNGAITEGQSAYLLFDDRQKFAEIHLSEKVVPLKLKLEHTGSWTGGEYLLIAWKGWVLQYRGKPIFGGE